MKTSSIFKSRWMALLWAAGIIWFAVDYASPKTPSPTNSSASAGTQSDGTDSSADRQAVDTALQALNADGN